MGYQLMLRKIRKTKHMTQNELAKAIGSTVRIIGSWERGETDISLEDAFSICLVLSCTPNDLCGWDGNNSSTSFAHSGQAALNGYYDSMNEAGRELLVQTAKSISADPERHIVKDSAEHSAYKAAMGPN